MKRSRPRSEPRAINSLALRTAMGWPPRYVAGQVNTSRFLQDDPESPLPTNCTLRLV